MDRLLHPVDLPLPRLPEPLAGLRIAHVTDLHVRRPRRRHDRIVAALADVPLDLLVLTGDYMSDIGDEPTALAVLERLCTAAKPRLGAVGVFGNHDSAELRRQCAAFPVHWLSDACWHPDQVPLEVIGLNFARSREPDAPAALSDRIHADHAHKLCLLLCHMPTTLSTAADLGVDLMFAGHTHGGQWRLPGGYALYNSTDLPKHLSAGLLRQDQTLCSLSRGLGESNLQIRLFCPIHIPLLTLRRGPLPGRGTSGIESVERW